MTVIDVRAGLAGLLGHLNHHPDLIGTTVDTRVTSEMVEVVASAYDSTPRLSLLATWVGTLAGVSTVAVRPVTSFTHLAVVGRLVDGGPVKVAVLLNPEESEQLGRHVSVVAGSEFTVATLLRLTTPYRQAHRYCGSNSERQSVGDPGHCEDCCSVGHLEAHSDLGCGDVGCYSDHTGT